MEPPTPGADAPDDDALEPAIPPAPAVVAVMVARDPGPWFEECMSSLAQQDYPNLSILVIDANSAQEVKRRVATSAPGAFVRRLDANPGFGAAANEVLEVVDGAAFYLVCHDDIALDPDVVRLLVEEAYRSNAAVVGPKLVQWDDPSRLLQVGEGMDHAGYVAPPVERGELDQEQHDAVRDVFAIPGACTLVRSDLFAAIGGFDEGIDYLLDDVSLCWRAHVAGARVVVAPMARVRHLEALFVRRPVDDRRQLQARHRLRMVLTCYSVLGLVRILPRLIVLNLAETVYALIVGRTGQARDTVSAWVWNLRRISELRDARQQVERFRTLPDREVRVFMARGSARFSQFLRGQIGGGEDRLSGWTRSGRDVAGTMTGTTFRIGAVIWSTVLLVLLAGSRHLVTRGVPAVGELVPFSSSSLDLLRTWASGWRTAGLGSESPAPTGLGLVGVLGGVSFGAMGMLRTVLTVGMLPLGALAIHRLAAPLGSPHARSAALLVYICNPLPYNALATGRWGALALYGTLPVVVGMLARSSGLPPFGPASGLRRHILALGLLTAVLAALAPAVVLIVLGVAVAMALGSMLTYSTRGSGRIIATAAAAAGVAIALHLPWSADYLLPGTPWSAVVGTDRGAQPSDLGALLRFQVGPLGSAPLGWVVLVAAALPLLIARAERHAWAVRGWTIAVVFWGLAWASQRDALPIALPSPELLLAPCAVGLALAAAMGVVAFEVDLPGYRFGWRQIAAGVAAAAVVIGTIPVLGAAFDGRWSMPRGDHSRALQFIDAAGQESSFRVLWLGDPMALPLGSWELGDGLAYATTDSRTPRLEDLWTAADDGRTRLLADALQLARSGQTARLGRLLAPMGVAYIVVPDQLAPAPFADASMPVSGALKATLDAQLDLEPIDVPAGLTVFANQAFYPTRAAVPTASAPSTGGGTSAAARTDLSSAPAVLPYAHRGLRWTGPVKADTTVLFASAHSARWKLTVDGKAAVHSKPYGWANGFAVATDGTASLSFATSPQRYLLLLLQALAWWWVGRRVLRARTAAPELAPEGVTS